MNHNVYIYLFIMAGVTYAIRVLPLTLVRRQIQNKYISSFLYYVPYVTLAVMTFPAILHATQNLVSGFLALIAGVFFAWQGANLFKVSIICCITVLFAELFLC